MLVIQRLVERFIKVSSIPSVCRLSVHQDGLCSYKLMIWWPTNQVTTNGMFQQLVGSVVASFAQPLPIYFSNGKLKSTPYHIPPRILESLEAWTALLCLGIVAPPIVIRGQVSLDSPPSSGVFLASLDLIMMTLHRLRIALGRCQTSYPALNSPLSG